MKLTFKAQDSIYKIFKTLQKIPSYKKVKVFIDHQHSLFHHQRRGEQIKEEIEKNHLQVVFVCKTLAAKEYFNNCELATQYNPASRLQRARQSIEWLAFWSKKAHKNLLVKKTYLSYLVLLSEWAVIFLVIYFFWNVLSPNATLHITPAHHVESIVYNFRFFPMGNPTKTYRESFWVSPTTHE